ncbi:putative signal transducing protein [Rhodanobacter umsongensis]
MRCVHRSFDHAEAEIVAGLLREEGCTAFVFEGGLSRLKWYQVIAFGGAVVMVPDACIEQACDVLARWRRGDYRLEDDDQCPHCHSRDIEENPNYRGWAFFFGCFLGLPIWPVLKWRERCRSCGHHWKATPPYTYAELSASIAEAGTPARDE